MQPLSTLAAVWGGGFLCTAVVTLTNIPWSISYLEMKNVINDSTKTFGVKEVRFSV